MFDERRKTRDERSGETLLMKNERKNVIASVAKQSIIILSVASFFSACSDYVSEMEDEFEAWKKTSSGIDSEESSSSAKSNGSADYDCSVSDGVKVVYPAGGEKFKVGQTIDVVFGTDLDDDGGYRVVFKRDASEAGFDLLDDSFDLTGPADGKTCYTVKVKLDAEQGVEATSNGVIRVIPYNRQNKGASSKEFVVEKGLNEEPSSSSIESSSSVKGTSSSTVVSSSTETSSSVVPASSSGAPVSAPSSATSSATSSSVKVSSSSVAVSSSTESSSSAIVSSSSVSSSSIITLPSGAVVQKGVSLYWGDHSDPYDIVTIGSQTWMAENLYSQLMSPYCFQNRTDYCEMYGRLYTLSLTENSCPDGWHVPDSTDWKILLEAVGNNSAKKLKSEQWAGSDEFGFGVLPAGSGNINENWKQSYDATESCFWTSSETDEKNAAVLCFSSEENEVKWLERSKMSLYSTRCIKGEKKMDPKSSSSSVQSSSSFTVSSSLRIILGDYYSAIDLNADEGKANFEQRWMAENLHYWNDSFTSTEKTCFDDYYAYEQDNSVDLCEKYGRYYNVEEALFIHKQSTENHCWVLPDSQQVKQLISIVGQDVKKLYSEQMGGHNESKFNLLPAGYYTRDANFFNFTGNKELKTCFWIRLDNPSNPDKLAVYCFYEKGDYSKPEMTDEVRKARHTIRLIYDENYCNKNR